MGDALFVLHSELCFFFLPSSRSLYHLPSTFHLGPPPCHIPHRPLLHSLLSHTPNVSISLVFSYFHCVSSSHRSHLNILSPTTYTLISHLICSFSIPYRTHFATYTYVCVRERTFDVMVKSLWFKLNKMKVFHFSWETKWWNKRTTKSAPCGSCFRSPCKCVSAHRHYDVRAIK